MFFLPDLSVLLSFSVACFLLFITPGPDMSLFLAKTLSSGRKAGFACLVGALLGCGMHTILAALGISALLHASEVAFSALKIIGAVYLLWLAFNAIRSGSTFRLQVEKKQEVSFWQNMLVGIGINLSNPKVVLFFVTFLPQFVQAGDPHTPSKLLFLGIFFMMISGPLCVLLILGANKVTYILQSKPKILRVIDYSFAGIFGAFALRMLTLGR
ncbi:LysE family translocator [Microvirga sp. W0021]|uniref:LysE family translocator n=1 Tax=Hohaiivirga grylli TaxID=3133970 RepID=A0ABV0BHC7_9HYPH